MAAKSPLLLADVVVSLGAAVSSFTEKTALKKLIDKHGGKVAYMINSETTHFITDEEEVKSKTLKYRTAVRYGCFVISKDWLIQTCEKCERQPELSFALYKDERMEVVEAPTEFVRSALTQALLIMRALSQGIAEGSLKSKEDGLFGLKDYEFHNSSSVAEEKSKDAVAHTFDESGGTEEVKKEEPAWIEAMTRKARAQKEKRLREQEERKLQMVEDLKSQRMEGHEELLMSMRERKEYYREQKAARDLARRAARLAQLQQGWEKEKARHAERVAQKLMEKEKKKQAWLVCVKQLFIFIN